MPNEHLDGLLEPVLHATEAGQIPWEASDEGELLFTATAGTVQLLLACVDRDNQAPYYLAVGRIDQPAETMEQVRQVWDGEAFRPETLTDLWDRAKRLAFGLDEVINDLKTFLATNRPRGLDATSPE